MALVHSIPAFHHQLGCWCPESRPASTADDANLPAEIRLPHHWPTTRAVEPDSSNTSSNVLFDLTDLTDVLPRFVLSSSSSAVATAVSLRLLEDTLAGNLSVSNCIQARRMSSSVHALPKLRESCDAFIGANFSQIVAEERLVSLPRVQVNVDVSRLEDFDARSFDSSHLTERIVPAVVRQLQLLRSSPSSSSSSSSSINSSSGSSSGSGGSLLFEENLVMMELRSDFSVASSAENKRGVRLSGVVPCKKPQSTATSSLTQKPPLTLTPGNAIVNTWNILASRPIGMGAVAVLNSTEDLLVLNLQMVSKGSPTLPCPISPTTGIPLAASNDDTFFSQMIQSRSGFGLALVDDRDGALMSVGGFERGGVLRTCEFFNVGTNSWLPGRKLTTPRARFAVAQDEGKGLVYAIGGSDGRAELKSVEVFSGSGSGKTWAEHPSKLCTARSNFGAAVLGGKIYAVGGSHYSSLLKSAETFDLSTQQWAFVAPMNTGRKGAAVVACRGSVFAIGGQASAWGCLNSVERYDPIANQWHKASPMAVPRRDACAISVDGLIYVIGGYNGATALKSMEVYDPSSDKWTRGQPMALKRSSAAALLVGGDVYVVGGFSGSVFLNSMEKYNLHSKLWSSFIVH